MHIAVCFWTLYVGKNGGVEFWQIFVDEANSEEYFGESDDRSSVVSLYLQALLRKFLANCASFIKFSLSNNYYFPMHISANTIRVVHLADIEFGNLATNIDYQTFSLEDFGQALP